jgi:TolA-binding protein
MKHSPTYPEDLLVLARRGGLSSRELEQLEQGLQVSYTLRVADEVGRAFDRIAEVQQGDEQRIAGCVDRVIDRASASVVRAPRAWRLGLMAAIVLGSASAMGYWGVHYWNQGSEPTGNGVRTPNARPPGPSSLSGLVGARQSAGSTRTAPPVSAGGEPSAEHAVSPASDSPRASNFSRSHVGSAQGWSRSGATAAFPAEQASPAAVFSAANAARRAGRQDRAMTLFLELQRDYPSSAEASLSHVSLGRLLFGRHELAGALAQFSTYLRGGGPLEEEALLGKAQTLAALGRQEDERAAWQSLLKRYPHSVYAAEAREHLGTERR